MGGPWRGGGTDFWVPPDGGSAHPGSRALYRVPIPTLRRPPNAAAFPWYVVPILTRTPTAGTPPQFSPSAASSPSAPACPRRLKIPPLRRTHRTSALLSSPPRATPRGKFDGGGLGGPWRDGRTDFWVPPDGGSAHPGSRALYCVPIPTLRRPPNAAAFPWYVVPILTRTPTAGTPPQFSPSAASSPSAPACPRRLKIPPLRRTHRTSALLSSPPRATPRGKFDGGGLGGPWRDGRTDFWVPPDGGSPHPASRALYRVPIPTLRRPPNTVAFPWYVVPILTRTPTAGTPPQFSPTAASSPSAPAPPRRLKNSATPPHPSHFGSALLSTACHPTEEI